MDKLMFKQDVRFLLEQANVSGIKTLLDDPFVDPDNEHTEAETAQALLISRLPSEDTALSCGARLEAVGFAGPVLADLTSAAEGLAEHYGISEAIFIIIKYVLGECPRLPVESSYRYESSIIDSPFKTSSDGKIIYNITKTTKDMCFRNAEMAGIAPWCPRPRCPSGTAGCPEDIAPFVYHATSWEMAEHISTNGVKPYLGRPDLDFGRSPSFYVTPSFSAALKWCHCNRTVFRNQCAILVFHLTKGIAEAEGLTWKDLSELDEWRDVVFNSRNGGESTVDDFDFVRGQILGCRPPITNLSDCIQQEEEQIACKSDNAGRLLDRRLIALIYLSQKSDGSLFDDDELLEWLTNQYPNRRDHPSFNCEHLYDGSGPMLSYQENAETVSRFMAIWNEKHASTRAGQIERSGHPFGVLAGASGVGKTRFLIELGRIASLPVAILSYNNGNEPTNMDSVMGPELSLSARLLHAIFVRPNQPFESFARDLQTYLHGKTLSFRACVKLALGVARNQSLIVAVDEINVLVEWDRDGRFLSSISRTIGCCLRDIGGLPRFVKYFITECLAFAEHTEDLEKWDYVAIMNNLKTVTKRRYMGLAGRFGQKIIQHVVLQTIVHRNDVVDPLVDKDCSYGILEQTSDLVLQDRLPGYIISIPYIWIRYLLENPTSSGDTVMVLLRRLMAVSEPISYWQQFEDFAAAFEAVKLMFTRRTRDDMTLASYFGVLDSTCPKFHMKFKLVDNISVTSLDRHFPKSGIFKDSDTVTDRESREKRRWTDGKTIVVNGADAPFADLFFAITLFDGRRILVCGQCKLYRKRILTKDCVDEELEKVRSRFKNVPGCHDFILVLYATKVSPNLQMHGDDYIVLGPVQLEAHFGSSMAARALYLLENQRVNVNTFTFQEIMGMRGVHTQRFWLRQGVGPEKASKIVEARKNGPFLTKDDFVTRTGLKALVDQIEV
ncbi:hypothetical protein M427DRAFT_50276 [Gonapodya prolifera JEL478]|uniref:Uncharacterized protein n=1 Tax=Gonapodya prolifera (strain JEL478) TaxID=1344416 RepID=A0A138ZWJ2_GONPJ|nr:hypothetical protein M427DRAFT_50276 [Gonapodya prolifera JEL478]|eukprot:KXS08841.1 hypothetical protein M427DRAFT_50276 [Gonapodya prolifera JEL478]